MLGTIIGKTIGIARLVGAGTLLALSAACVDVDMSVEILGPNHAKGTNRITISRDFYEMAQAQGDSSFCSDTDELIEENALVTCIMSQDGTFAELLEQEGDQPAPTIQDLGDGTVRVSLPIGSLAQEATEQGADPEMLAMMAGMFEGKELSISIIGREIIDTNMDISTDHTRAKVAYSLLDIISGEIEVPDEVYAVVRSE